MRLLLRLVLSLSAVPFASSLQAQTDLLGVQKISDRYGAFPTPLHNGDQLGRAVTGLGDLDGDGVGDLAASCHGDDDGGLNRGAVHVMLLAADGTVKATQKISSLAGGFVGPLDDGDQIGRGLAGLGDLDGDGIPDLAVGANFDDDGGPNRGAVWILYLNRDGTVRAQAKISSTSGGLVGLRNRDEFGRSVAAAGDLDGDGVPDLVVGAPYDDAGGANFGAVYLLTLRPDGSVKSQSKISRRDGGFNGVQHGGDLFGFSVAAPGDLDGDAVADLLVGAVGDDDGGMNAGALWVLFLRADGSVKAHQKLGGLDGGMRGLEAGDQFGVGVTAIGDLDGDGRPELAVGAVKDDDGGLDRGSVYLLTLSAGGSVTTQKKLSALSGGFPLALRNGDWFGCSVGSVGDLNGDGLSELAIGARMDDDMGRNRGAVYVTFLGGAAALTNADAGPTIRTATIRTRANTLHVVTGAPTPGERLTLAASEAPFGASIAPRLLLSRARLGGTADRSGRLAVDPDQLLWPTLRRTQEDPTRAVTLDIPGSATDEPHTLFAQLVWLDPSRNALAFSDVLELEF